MSSKTDNTLHSILNTIGNVYVSNQEINKIHEIKGGPILNMVFADVSS
jgi:hypothetical protein